jgi:hypothetical protein
MGVSLGNRWKYFIKAILSRRENRVFLPIIMIISILIFYSLTSIFTSIPSKPQLSIYSDTWGDLSDCRNDLENINYSVSSIISTPTVLTKFNEDEFNKKIYMGIGIERSFTTEDSDAIWSFVRKGGNVVLADDFGYGNSFWNSNLNEGYGKAEFRKKQLFDPNYIKNTTFVTIYARLPWINSEWYQLLLNAPTALKRSSGSAEMAILAESSEDSWLDENDNRIRDPGELKGEYPIIMYFQPGSGAGKVFIISDPGLFINENWDQMDNSKFVLHLINYLLPNGGEVIFDESRHISDNTFENTRRTMYSGAVYFTSSIISIILVVALIISFTLWIGVKLKPQPNWKNQNLLNSKFLNILNYPYITNHDYWLIYSTFLDKVRISYGFSSEDFKTLDWSVLYNLIHDEYLWSFFYNYQQTYVDSYYYRFIIKRMMAWEPDLPEEDRDLKPFKQNNEADGRYDEYTLTGGGD